MGDPVLRVGLTGGLASGKSAVGRELARLGCHVIEADKLGHEVLLPGGEAYEPVLREFGAEAILDPSDRTIDRKKLGAIVFEDKQRLDTLNSIVHPVVRRVSDAKIAAIEAADPHGILIYEAAILIETGGYRDFDKLIVAACPVETQIERAMARDGCTRAEAEARVRNQMPLSTKLRYADYVIDTSGSVEQTHQRTRSVFEDLSKRSEQ
jgi:dephospho-CoA kinase